MTNQSDPYVVHAGGWRKEGKRGAVLIQLFGVRGDEKKPNSNVWGSCWIDSPHTVAAAADSCPRWVFDTRELQPSCRTTERHPERQRERVRESEIEREREGGRERPIGRMTAFYKQGRGPDRRGVSD